MRSMELLIVAASAYGSQGRSLTLVDFQSVSASMAG